MNDVWDCGDCAYKSEASEREVQLGNEITRLREALEACDAYLNWHESRIVPTKEVPDQGSAYMAAKRAVKAALSTRRTPTGDGSPAHREVSP